LLYKPSRQYFFVALFLVPETPCWLVQKNQQNKAFHILSKTKGKANAQAELLSISHSFSSQSAGTLKNLLLPR